MIMSSSGDRHPYNGTLGGSAAAVVGANVAPVIVGVRVTGDAVRTGADRAEGGGEERGTAALTSITIGGECK